MLSILRIKNLALVADVTIDFQSGLNVITGETGAGKSVLIGALTLVLGQRADRDLIRSGADACSVEAVFETKGLGAELSRFSTDNGLEAADEQLIIKRTITTAGASRQFVNGSPTTVGILAKLGEWLVDIHGPHEHQSLLHRSRQLEILDAFGGLQQQREDFTRLLEQHNSLRREKAALVIDEKAYAQQLDLLRFQVREIAAARLQPNEDADTEAEHRRASNAARLLELAQQASETLSEEESSIIARGGAVGRMVQELAGIDPTAKTIVELHVRCMDMLAELQAELSHYRDKVEIDPDRLRELEERINLVQGLKRKYGSSVGEVIAFGQEAERKLRSLEERDAELERINGEMAKVEAELARVGGQLAGQRRKVIPQLSKAVIKELNALGFGQSCFDVALETNQSPSFGSGEVSRSGFDAVEFQFAPNPGEPPRALRSIASSGEIARVMLALKTVLAAVDRIPVLVFDEVDANIGGETGHVVGQKMEQISCKRQVICITHLAQVAAHGSVHFLVTKHVKSGRTYSEITMLGKTQRVEELARMLGGQSEAATRHAQSLLKQ
ncbi:MAG TPA: DNA repair protein RecN [Verrucomicrobiae bacterium]|nr:DNA repair protein RecN [Verrucomicrobiae bacterium]